MEVDCYRLAYNTFHRNWQRFGIPEKDIPFAKTDEVEPFNLIIPGFSNATVLFQITSRRDLKTILDECPKVHNMLDFCTRFEKVMQKAFPEHSATMQDLPKDTVEELPRDAVKEDLSEGTSKKGLPEVATKEDQSENTVETNLSEDNTEEDLSEDSKMESLSEDARMKGQPEDVMMKSLPEDVMMKSLPEDVMMKSLSEDTMETCLSVDTTEEDLSEDSKKKSVSKDGKKDENEIKPEEVPAIIAYSLAVCTEFVLYQYEDNKEYVKHMSEMWLKYFNEHMKDQCDEAGCTYDQLKAYSNNIWCSDDLLNKFVTENKNEYHEIMAKFRDFIQTNYAVESPEDSEFITEVVNVPGGLCFAKMKAQFRTIMECCKCVKTCLLPKKFHCSTTLENRLVL